jgi:DNA-binding response OmpR family regulator
MADAPRIVIVEDDPETLEFLTFLLQLSDYEVEGALHGAAAWQSVRAAPVQAILLDRRLPDVDGLTLCQDLHAAFGTNIPIIMMSADSEAGLLAASQAAGATTLLRKPFPPQTLLDALATVLGT